jgi:hypothetical protein
MSLLEGVPLQQTYPKIFAEKKQNMQVVLYRLQEKLNSLKDREEELLVEFRGLKEKQERLLTINQQQQINLQKDLTLKRAFFQALFGTGPLEINNIELPKKPVINMPYCILVDFDNTEIYVKYHESIFEKVKSNDSISIKMVSENIRLFKDLR